MKKEATKITEANGGMHNQKAYVKMKYMITANTYKKPRLYHLILMGSEMPGEYQSALKALCVELRRKKVECRWKAALESEKTKGLHMHVFILTNAEYYNPNSILKGSRWLREMLAKRSLRYHLAPPQAAIHANRKGKQLRYATLANQAKIDDCLLWISYLVKNRTKCKGMRNIYFSSRDRAKTATNGI